MKIEALIKMANEIAAFFEGEGGDGEAPEQLASHLRKFWEPRMRKEIIAYYQTDGGGLDDVALKGLALLASDKTPGALDAAAKPN